MKYVLNCYKETNYCNDGSEYNESEQVDEDLEFNTLEEAREYVYQFCSETVLEPSSRSGCGTITYYVATVHSSSEWHKFQENYEAEPLPLWEWDSRTKLEIEAWGRAVSSNKAWFGYKDCYEFDNVQQAYSSLCEQKKNCIKTVRTIIEYFNNEADVRKVEDIVGEQLNFRYAEKQDAYKLASKDKWVFWGELAECCETDEYGGCTLEDADWLEGWMDDYSEACEFMEKAENELKDALDTLYLLVDEEKEEELWNELSELAFVYDAIRWE